MLLLQRILRIAVCHRRGMPVRYSRRSILGVVRRPSWTILRRSRQLMIEVSHQRLEIFLLRIRMICTADRHGESVFGKSIRILMKALNSNLRGSLTCAVFNNRIRKVFQRWINGRLSSDFLSCLLLRNRSRSLR